MKTPHKPDLNLSFNTGYDINGNLLPGNYIWYNGSTGEKGWYTIRRRKKDVCGIKRE